MITTRCQCTLCGVGWSGSDIGRYILGIGQTKDDAGNVNGIQIVPPNETDKHLCVMCVGQIQSTDTKHWLIQYGTAKPLAQFI